MKTSWLNLAVFVGLSFTSCAVSAQETPPTTISGLIDSSPLVSISNNPSDRNIVAVYCERAPQWWGRLMVYHRNGDRIDWPFSLPKNHYLGGSYVVRFRWIHLKQIEGSVLEVIGSTHRGNGSLQLFEIAGRELRLLLETKVRGLCFWPLPKVFNVPSGAEARFEGNHLYVDYRMADDPSADNVVLTGSIRIEDSSGKVLPSQKYKQICIWNSDKKVFETLPPTLP